MKRNTNRLIFVSSLLLFVGSLVGIFLSFDYITNETINKHGEINVMPLLEKEFNEEKLSFSYIFVNNLRVVLLLSFGGVLTFGGLTFLNLILNGINLGILFYDSLLLGDLKAFFLLIFPHGVFEIPGMIIAGAAGFKIPYEVLRFALSKKEEIITEEDAKEFFKLVSISIVLIFIAALIESTITLKIAESLR
ncbi:MAG: stage sporulation protein [Pyrococcus sp.]|uniref:stage II sporulation protein M n=1 Tax=Pyrococcus sp. TaxID=33866 RepID=UPI0025878D93|nr:stage II sporulation protein M [Pyrococcus sp.]MDK2869050.1 stage sporulation protein [Pyrococcus sp.]